MCSISVHCSLPRLAGSRYLDWTANSWTGQDLICKLIPDAMGRRELNSARTVKDAGGWVGRQWNFMKFRTKTPSLKLREMSHPSGENFVFSSYSKCRRDMKRQRRRFWRGCFNTTKCNHARLALSHSGGFHSALGVGSATASASTAGTTMKKKSSSNKTQKTGTYMSGRESLGQLLSLPSPLTEQVAARYYSATSKWRRGTATQKRFIFEGKLQVPAVLSWFPIGKALTVGLVARFLDGPFKEPEPGAAGAYPWNTNFADAGPTISTSLRLKSQLACSILISWFQDSRVKEHVELNIQGHFLRLKLEKDPVLHVRKDVRNSGGVWHSMTKLKGVFLHITATHKRTQNVISESYPYLVSDLAMAGFTAN